MHNYNITNFLDKSYFTLFTKILYSQIQKYIANKINYYKLNNKLNTMSN